MNIIETEFPGVAVIENFYQYDIRGSFIKLYNEALLDELGINIQLKEIYYSTSQKDVIRGMHFQLPPYEHAKIVHVIKGSVTDVLVDLRKESIHYGEVMEIHLTGNRPRSVFIPKGIAHGFKCLENNTIMLYQVTSGYSPAHDAGIAWDSIGYDWNIADPIISERDADFISLKEFDSPF
ncbi:MAG: dTDP-4-dehydrorhamnose 3,5-epimerase family protein [Lachnospiraceae bacterium]|nr:dTDP-4-dehydrorhamnose 3,5-epimerase family protein [Lachnospiraceae bacterium]MDE7238123.1 dTDP-4-dehydrorhamnose 3,5-epimerase family protein [Lachnospiraceae bacterium]